MNIRKNIDYSGMYAAIDDVMEQNLSQMELYCSIGQAVAARNEKGAAVMAAEYIKSRYPDARGFSPRNLRRMRDFYRTYENYPSLLSLSMEIGWTHNVIIIEADLTMELRGWYLRAVRMFGWSKAELIDKVAGKVHEEIVLGIRQEICDSIETLNDRTHYLNTVKKIKQIHRQILMRRRCRARLRRGVVPWNIMRFPIFVKKRIAFMRC